MSQILSTLLRGASQKAKIPIDVHIPLASWDSFSQDIFMHDVPAAVPQFNEWFYIPMSQDIHLKGHLYVMQSNRISFSDLCTHEILVEKPNIMKYVHGLMNLNKLLPLVVAHPEVNASLLKKVGYNKMLFTPIHKAYSNTSPAIESSEKQLAIQLRKKPKFHISDFSQNENHNKLYLYFRDK